MRSGAPALLGVLLATGGAAAAPASPVTPGHAPQPAASAHAPQPAAAGHAPVASPSTATNPTSAPAASASPATAAAAPGPSCIERIPEGKTRPQISEKFPDRGLSGHVATLQVVVPHGKGETVLPSGIRLQAAGEAVRALERAGFVIPSPDGPAAPKMNDSSAGDRVETTVRIPFVLLPPKSGRHTLTLPPVPITLQRASGDIVTVCTAPHDVLVEDPTANTPNPNPHDNPAPRRQREVWKLAKTVLGVGLVALVVGGLFAWLIGKWIRRPRPVPPPPPPRPPWEVALEELFDIRHAGLVKALRFTDHYDRVSNAIRRYLGDRYGFDGLECTTRETLTLLREVRPEIGVMQQISGFLRQADLVKFARLTPTAEECSQVLDLGEEIVRRTVPAPGEQTFVPATESPGDDAQDDADARAAEPAPAADGAEPVDDPTQPPDEEKKP